MAQTTVTKCYGIIYIKYPCGRCGQTNALECPQIAGASAVGANPGAGGVASGRLSSNIKSHIQDDLETIQTADPIAFYEHNHGFGKRCTACGFLEVWQRDKYERNMIYGIQYVVAMGTIILSTAVLVLGVSIGKLLSYDNKLILSIPAICIFAVGIFLTFFLSTSFKKRIHKEFSQTDSEIGLKSYSKPVLEFRQDSCSLGKEFLKIHLTIFAEITGSFRKKQNSE